MVLARSIFYNLKKATQLKVVFILGVELDYPEILNTKSKA
jgi:hypothetical protein